MTFRATRFRARLLAFLVVAGASGPAFATMTIPEALSNGQQQGANQEEAAGASLNSMSSTTGAVTGTQNTQAVGNPADGAATKAGATATGSYPFTLNCHQTGPRNPIFPGDYGLFAANCTYSGSGAQSAVSGFTLGYCLASIQGGNCVVGSSNWQYSGIGPGQSVQLTSSVSALVNSCPANGSGSCTGTLTVNNSTVHTANAGSLSNDATNEVVSGTNGVQNAMEKTFVSGSYQSALQTGNNQYKLSACTQQITGGLNGNGIVYTCNGQQSANFNAQNCQSSEQCVKWATQTESYTQTCNADIPLSERTCNTQTPVQNCTITDPTNQYTCQNTLTATVTAANSCTPGQWYTLGSSTQCGVGYCGNVTLGTAGGECYQYTLQALCNPGSQTLQYTATSAYWGQGASGTLYASWSGSLSNGESAELNDPSMSSNNCEGGWDWYPDISVQTFVSPLGNVTGSIAFHAWTGPAGYSPLVSCADPTLVAGSGPTCVPRNECSNSQRYGCFECPHGKNSCTTVPYCPGFAFGATVFCNQVPGDGPSACNYAGGSSIAYDGHTYTCNGGLGHTATGDLTQTFGINFVQQTKTVSDSWNNGCAIYANTP